MSYSGMPICCIRECLFNAVFDFVFRNNIHAACMAKFDISLIRLNLLELELNNFFEFLNCFVNLNNPGDTSCMLIFNW